MADNTISMNSSWRMFFAICSLVYCGATVAYLVLYGNPANSLHQSALSWCFMTGLAVLGAVGLPTVLDVVAAISGRKG